MGLQLAFYKARKGGLLDWVIDTFTGGKGYSHVQFLFSDGKSFVCSPRIGGCRFETTEYKADEWDMITVPLTDQEEETVREFCEQQDGKKYDWFGALGIPMPDFFHQNKKKWFCTEVVITSFQQVRMMVPLKPWKYSPNKFSVLAKRPGIWARYL